MKNSSSFYVFKIGGLSRGNVLDKNYWAQQKRIWVKKKKQLCDVSNDDLLVPVTQL